MTMPVRDKPRCRERHSAGQRILMLSGSKRAASLNRALLRAMSVRVAEHGIELWWSCVDLHAIPHFDQELEQRGLLPGVRQLAAEIALSNAMLVATPEYNGGIPSNLKNAVDWLSRLEGQGGLKDLPVAVVSASPSRFGAQSARSELMTMLTGRGARPVATPVLALAEADAHLSNGVIYLDPAAAAATDLIFDRLMSLAAEFQPPTLTGGIHA